jgi:hypothetical protein
MQEVADDNTSDRDLLEQKGSLLALSLRTSEPVVMLTQYGALSGHPLLLVFEESQTQVLSMLHTCPTIAQLASVLHGVFAKPLSPSGLTHCGLTIPPI